jgi:hypothetical protein
MLFYLSLTREPEIDLLEAKLFTDPIYGPKMSSSKGGDCEVLYFGPCDFTLVVKA